MALKIRMRMQGRTNRPFFRLVVTNSRSPRDGKYVEMVGWYNPFESDAQKGLFVDKERVQHWLGQGAQLAEGTETLLARVAPEIVNQQIQKVVAHKAKMASKRKARAKVAK
jgi:small subunit ribosomal protein S16